MPASGASTSARHARRNRASTASRPTRRPPAASAAASSSVICGRRRRPRVARCESNASASWGRWAGSRSSSQARTFSRASGTDGFTLRASGAASRRRRPSTSPAPPVTRVAARRHAERDEAERVQVDAVVVRCALEHLRRHERRSAARDAPHGAEAREPAVGQREDHALRALLAQHVARGDVVVDEPAQVERAQHARAVLEEAPHLVGRQARRTGLEARAGDEPHDLEATVLGEAALVEDLGPVGVLEPPQPLRRRLRIAGAEQALEALDRDVPAAVEEVLGELHHAVGAGAEGPDDPVPTGDDSSVAGSRTHDGRHPCRGDPGGPLSAATFKPPEPGVAVLDAISGRGPRSSSPPTPGAPGIAHPFASCQAALVCRAASLRSRRGDARLQRGDGLHHPVREGLVGHPPPGPPGHRRASPRARRTSAGRGQLDALAPGPPRAVDRDGDHGGASAAREQPRSRAGPGGACRPSRASPRGTRRATAPSRSRAPPGGRS